MPARLARQRKDQAIQEDLAIRRRALSKLYLRYLRAERAWEVATAAAIAWLPSAPPPKLTLIGDPGSRIRRIYEEREQARLRLLVAREKLETARRRHAERRRRQLILLISR